MFETRRHFDLDRAQALVTLQAMMSAGQEAMHLLSQTQDPALYDLLKGLIEATEKAGKIYNYSSEIKALRSKTAAGTPVSDAQAAPAA